MDHVNEAIVAALREAGLLAEGEVVGYASVLKKAEWKQWNFTGAGPYVSEVEARSNTKPYPVEGWESRVAALHLLPDTEEGLE